MVPATCGGVLVASPNGQVREQVLTKLKQHGPVHAVSGGAEALARLEDGDWQVLFLDRRLPDLDSDGLVEIIERRFPQTRVVLVDANAPETQTTAFSRWADRVPTRTLALPQTRCPERNLQSSPLPGMIGETEPMRQLYRMVGLVARRDTTVLITGPTGSGKDLVARAIHQLSPRAQNGFFVLNCAAIPESLVESELFGFVRGAFTGAAQTYSGRILAAQNGTLFLDEIGDLPLPAQSKLLRFLEQKEIQRLGSAETTKVNVRVVAATHQDLGYAVEQGRFREDLFFRLSAFPIHLVPLAERGADIFPIANQFLSTLAANGPALQLDTKARQKLEAHSWPGNVRELLQVLERATILVEEGTTIFPEHIVFSPTRGKRAETHADCNRT